MFPGAYKHLRICVLDPYDLALSKLERNIQRDPAGLEDPRAIVARKSFAGSSETLNARN
jgi:hypothetical protein